MVINEGLRTLLKHMTSPPPGTPERDWRKVQKEIVDYIKANRAELPFEDIMEGLAEIGRCPQLVNNDNDGWYVTDSGMNTVITDDDIIDNPLDMGEFVTWVRNRAWKSSIRGALYDYLDREQEDIPRDEKPLTEQQQKDLDDLADF